MKVIRKEQCPECAKLGKDRSKDNLVVYSDGHKWCYSCGYYVGIDGVMRLKQSEFVAVLPKSPVVLPADCDFNYPDKALDWVYQYELTKNDLYKHNILWSEFRQRLIFPIFDNYGTLLAYQGRYFGEDKEIKAKQKWFSIGNMNDIIHIIGEDNKVFLTEDIVSAIKLGNISMAIPLFGCIVGNSRFKRYKHLFNKTKVIVWLDPDKRLEAVKEARKGTLIGLNCTSIFSEKDPKEMKYSELTNIIEGV
jgi:hypothetical protein